MSFDPVYDSIKSNDQHRDSMKIDRLLDDEPVTDRGGLNGSSELTTAANVATKSEDNHASAVSTLSTALPLRDPADPLAHSETAEAPASNTPGRVKAVPRQQLATAKAKNLKKPDGEPLLRKDIRFEFLMHLFINNYRIFTNDGNLKLPSFFYKYKDPESGEILEHDGRRLNFFELYLATLLKSDRLSKTLRQRIDEDINYALCVVCICFLVNFGRFNTTINFDYEMRSQLRTYHSIPPLQVTKLTQYLGEYYVLDPIESERKSNEAEVDSTPNSLDFHVVSPEPDYQHKDTENFQSCVNLPDTPRLKSILKSINDTALFQPMILEELFTEIINRAQKGEGGDTPSESTVHNGLNVITLIFSLSSMENQIGKLFFKGDNIEPSLFQEVFASDDISPEIKVKRFLWILIIFMESDLSFSSIRKLPFTQHENLKLKDDGSEEYYVQLSSGAKFNDLAQLYSCTLENTDYKAEVYALISSLMPPVEAPTKGERNEIDVDTPLEVSFGEYMRNKRRAFLQNPTDKTQERKKRKLELKEKRKEPERKTQKRKKTEKSFEEGTESGEELPSESPPSSPIKTEPKARTDISDILNSDTDDLKTNSPKPVAKRVNGKQKSSTRQKGSSEASPKITLLLDSKPVPKSGRTQAKSRQSRNRVVSADVEEGKLLSNFIKELILYKSNAIRQLRLSDPDVAKKYLFNDEESLKVLDHLLLITGNGDKEASKTSQETHSLLTEDSLQEVLPNDFSEYQDYGEFNRSYNGILNFVNERLSKIYD
ncbi:BA75_04244T0 [Komagataella pastoris]|uniref:BA75_04244T0 n=1 Tax=Komagataella pastoris TaxID=4922 RepID=A0A1B2JF24_PICPA|nr:BA75_04244T0 [Komagataella pastoris]